MGFIKYVLMGLLVVSIINLAFLNFMGDLSTNYGGFSGEGVNASYVRSIENISVKLRSSMNPEDISTSTGYTGLAGELFTGGKVVANAFSVMVGMVPDLLYSLVVGVSDVVGLPPEFVGLVLAGVSLMIIAALIEFVLRRRM